MAKKLEENGRWESMRMMLPEHREALIEYHGRKHARKRKEIDPQEWDVFMMALQGSMQMKRMVRIKLYDPLEDLTVIGVVNRIDSHSKRFMVDDDWIPLRDIEGVEVD